MNREHWKKMLPIIEAFVEGKTVEYLYAHEWTPVTPGDDEITFNKDAHRYRIKPEPKYRPWRPEEVPVGSVVKNVNTGLRSVILASEARGNAGAAHIIIHGFMLTEEQMLDHWTLLDGSPCGVEE